MPFAQRFVEPRLAGRVRLFDEDGQPRVSDGELEAVTNGTLCNALRQLASLVAAADDIFDELADELKRVHGRSQEVRVRIELLAGKVDRFDPKAVAVPESDICQFAALKQHFKSRRCVPKEEGQNLFTTSTRPRALSALYAAAATGPVAAVRQLDRWRRDGQRSSGFFVCTPVLQAKRRRMRAKVDIEIETRMPAAVEELRRWTSDEALGDVTVMPDCASRIPPVTTFISDSQDATDVGSGVVSSDDEGVDHKLPSPEEQLQVMALKFPAEVVRVDVSGRSFDRMSAQRRSLTHADLGNKTADGDTGGTSGTRRRTRGRRPRSRRRNTLAGTDQKEIVDALRADESSPTLLTNDTDPTTSGVACRSKSGDLFRSLPSKKEALLDIKKSHFDMLKQWGKSRYDKLMNKSSESKTSSDIDDFNVYETVTMKRKRDLDKERKTHERNSSISSSEKSVANVPVTSTLSSVMNIAVKLRESSAQRRQRRAGNNKDEPHSSSGNWSASSESGRASIGSEITTHPKSTTSAATSNNSLNQQPPSSVNSRRRFPVTTSGSSSMTSEGTLTPDIIHDLHEDGETSSVYSCDTEGYYTSFHMDSGLKTLKEEETPPTPLHSTSAFSNSGSNNTVLSAENEYELFGKGSTSTTTSSAGTVCTTIRAAESTRSLVIGPAVPERKSSLSKLSTKSPESSLERDFSSDKTGTVKRSPATSSKPTVVALVHKEDNNNGDVSPDSGHNTSSSPIESTCSPNGVRSGSDFEFSESSDMEGPERIERIRVKTTINSSRIPSMCVITPPHSDEESENSSSSSRREFKKTLQPKTDSKEPIQRIISTTVNGSNKISLVNVNPQSGYATIQSIDQPDSVVTKNEEKTVKSETSRSIRAPSPSGGTVIVKEEPQNKSPVQPVIKASLMPLNNMFGKIKMNIANFAQKRDRSKSPSANKDQQTKLEEFDAGEYVTIADVRNNNGKNLKTMEDITYANDVVNKNLTTVLSGKIRDTEYVCLNELPCNDNNNVVTSVNVDSLERKRQGARVKLDAEGKVVYSSDSLKRRSAHTTFEPGPNVKNTMDSPLQSPIPTHRIPKNLRPVNNNQENRPLSPQSGKLVIRASSGQTSSTSEIIRMPPSTIVTPATRPMSPKSRGAYVRMPEAAKSPVIGQDKEGARTAATQRTAQSSVPGRPIQTAASVQDMYRYGDPIYNHPMDTGRYLSNQYYHPGGNMYSTLPSKKTQYFAHDITTERSVTPDITRGLERNYHYEERDHSLPRNMYRNNQRMGIPVRMPDLNRLNLQVPLQTPKSYEDIAEPLKISPIDPRHSGSFQSSTPSNKAELKAASNLENKLLSPKKSTMSNEELYAVIHKSKKKMNIDSEITPRSSPITVQEETPVRQVVKSPETGYLDRPRSRLSWSPSKGEYVEFNNDIDKFSPPNESRSRQSWACSDRKPKVKQTSTIDFKRLLLQKSTTTPPKKISAVEQLKLSKQQIQSPQKPKSSLAEMNILDLSGSPRNLTNRRFANNLPGSPNREPKPGAKLLSPRSQWRFASPRSDVLSSTILEDCREDENSSNTSGEKSNKSSPRAASRSSNSPTQSIRSDNKSKSETSPSPSSCQKGMPRNSEAQKSYNSASQRLYDLRAQFFQQPVSQNKQNVEEKPLETSF